MNLITVNHRFKNRLNKRRNTRRIIVHHQAGNPVPASTMHQWHLDRGWAGIGYHYVIQPDGTIETGRPHDTVGSHARGANSDSIGVCFAGNIDQQSPTRQAVQAFIDLSQQEIFPRYGQLEIDGHRDHGNTSCPGRYMPMEELREGAMSKDTVRINGRKVDAPVRNVNNRLYIELDGEPGQRHLIQVRALNDLLGGSLQWDEKTRTADMRVR